MKDISKDPFPEYTRQREHDRSQLANAWYIGNPLQMPCNKNRHSLFLSAGRPDDHRTDADQASEEI